MRMSEKLRSDERGGRSSEKSDTKAPIAKTEGCRKEESHVKEESHQNSSNTTNRRRGSRGREEGKNI